MKQENEKLTMTEVLKQVIQTIKENPNDLELGKKMRSLYWSNIKILEDEI